MKTKLALLVIAIVAVWFFLPEGRFTQNKFPELTANELATKLSGLVFKDQDIRPLDTELVSLGKALFFDPNFSANGQVACATCHIPEKFFTDGKVHAFGFAQTAMHTPTIVNSRLNHWFCWDGRADSLAMQALGPIENNLEHNFSRVAVAKRLASAYKSQYENLFHIIPNYVEALPEIGPPLQPKAFVPLTVTAYALATLGSSQSLKAILKTSQSESLQPAEYLAQIGSRSLQSDDAFAQLSDVEQHTINQMFANFGTALAAFQSTIISKDSPFDLFAEKFIANQTRDPEFSFNARFGASEFAGLKIFLGQGQCTTCHTGPNFTDQQFHNIGLADLTKNGSINLGRSQGVMQVLRSPFNCKGNFLKLTKENQTESCLEESFINTESTEFVGAFKTPSLRNVAETAPYMHDGSFATLEDVLRHYNKLEATPAVGHREETLKPLNLNKKELEQLKAFLTSLSGQVSHQ